MCEYKHYYMSYRKGVFSMINIKELRPRQHIYEVEHCSGCGETIAGDYTEIGLPSADNSEVKHIALCPNCHDVAEKEAVI